MRLTPAQRFWLKQGFMDKAGRISVPVRARASGAVWRMLERLRERGLVEGPPWRITGLGEDAMAETKR
jgi:hypothetical protein